MFRYNLKYAELLDPDGIFILSAKYGLLDLNDIIAPYDQTLNDMATVEIKEWSNLVLKQIRDICIIENTEFIFLAGEKYRKFLLPYLKTYSIPLKGLRIGKQLQKLKELTA